MLFGFRISSFEFPAQAEPHWWDQFTGLRELLILLAALALIGLIFRYARGSSAIPGGFVIRVDGDDIQFTGRFPASMQATVANFLRNDVALTDRYEIRGHWEDTMLVVVVKGEAARPLEQRIRNFLKLSLKKPR